MSVQRSAGYSSANERLVRLTAETAALAYELERFEAAELVERWPSATPEAITAAAESPDQVLSKLGSDEEADQYVALRAVELRLERWGRKMSESASSNHLTAPTWWRLGWSLRQRTGWREFADVVTREPLLPKEAVPRLQHLAFAGTHPAVQRLAVVRLADYFTATIDRSVLRPLAELALSTQDWWLRDTAYTVLLHVAGLHRPYAPPLYGHGVVLRPHRYHETMTRAILNG